MDDYYKILEVGDTASQDEIRAAYRRLAKQHHPDLNQGNKDSEALFKKINEANDTLGDPQKRGQYDQQRRFGQGSAAGNPFHQHFGHGFPGADFSFNFGGGGNPFDDIMSQVFGQGFGRQQPPRNRDWQFTLNITLEDAFVGKIIPVQFDAHGQHTNINVTIPAGVQNGTRLKFQGQGDRSMGNLPPGDLYVTVSINEHPLFNRDGPHLHDTLTVDAIAAMLVTDQQFTGIDGHKLSVNVPAGTQHSTMLRVQGQGMPAHNNARQRGDLFLRLNVEICRDLTKEQQDLLRELQRQRSK